MYKKTPRGMLRSRLQSCIPDLLLRIINGKANPRGVQRELKPENYTNRHRDSCPGQDYSGRGRRECGIVLRYHLDSIPASDTYSQRTIAI